MASILEGFLVRLGFEVDQDGMLKFNNSISGAAKRVAGIGKVAAATGVALGAAFAKATSDVNKLYKVSNSTGASIRGFTAISRAVERVGGDAANVSASFDALAMNIKTYGKNFESMLTNQLGVSLYDQTGKMRDMADVFMDMRNALARIAETDPGLARAQAQAVGLGAAFDDIMRKDFPAEFDRSNRALIAMGTSLDDNAKRAHNLSNSFSRLWNSVTTGAQTAAMDFLEVTGIDKWLDNFATKVEKVVPATVNTAKETVKQYVSGERSVSKDQTISAMRRVTASDIEDAEGGPELTEYLERYKKKHATDRTALENIGDKFNSAYEKADRVIEGKSDISKWAPSSENGKFGNVRGFRNNNPGNLRTGKGQVGTDGGYAQFGSMTDGYKAMVNQVSMYRNAGLENVASIISKWAPSSENDTQSYIKSVVGSMQKSLGEDVTATSRLNLNDPRVMDSLIDAMINHENGAGASNYFGGEAFSQALQEAMQTKRASKVVTERDKIPSTVTVNQSITVNGAGDPMQTAKTIQRQTSETVNRNAGSNVM